MGTKSYSVKLLIALLSFLPAHLFSQTVSCHDMNSKEKFEVFKLKYTDSIDITGTIRRVNGRKPIIIFLQGSLPRPDIIITGKQDSISSTFSNFDVNLLDEKFNLVLISQPCVPLTA